MKGIYFIAFCFVFLMSCTTSTEKQSSVLNQDSAFVQTPPAKKDKTADTVLANPDFDHLRFGLLADSVITLITGDEIDLVCKTDTIIHPPTTAPYYRYLAPENATFVRYLFHPGKKNKWLQIRVFLITYPDSTSMNKAFLALQVDASDVNFNKTDEKQDISPCLTYTNDYAIKTGRQILWVNLACAYSTHNFNRMKGFLKSSSHAGIIADSITCQCGQSRCKD